MPDTTGYVFRPEETPNWPDDYVDAQGEASEPRDAAREQRRLSPTSRTERGAHAPVSRETSTFCRAYGTLPTYGQKINPALSGEIITMDVADLQQGQQARHRRRNAYLGDGGKAHRLFRRGPSRPAAESGRDGIYNENVGYQSDSRRKSGNMLVVTLLILFAISVIGATLAMISSMDLKIAGNQRATTRALPVAEAGLNEAIHRLSLPNPTNVDGRGLDGKRRRSATAEPYNPHWTARIYLTSARLRSGRATRTSATTGTIQDPNQPYLEYSAANGTDEVLTIQHKWRDLDGDNVRDANEIVRYDPLQMPPENLTSGFPVEVVTVTGTARATRSGPSRRRSRRERCIARTLGALYLRQGGPAHRQLRVLRIQPQHQHAGRHRPDRVRPYHLSSGPLPGVTTTGDNVQVQGSANVGGNPSPHRQLRVRIPGTRSRTCSDLDQGEVDAMLAQADNTSIVNPLNGITYINGDANVTSNLDRFGTALRDGRPSRRGRFTFRGLIYVEGDVHVHRRSVDTRQHDREGHVQFQLQLRKRGRPLQQGRALDLPEPGPALHRALVARNVTASKPAAR